MGLWLKTICFQSQIDLHLGNIGQIAKWPASGYLSLQRPSQNFKIEPRQPQESRSCKPWHGSHCPGANQVATARIPQPGFLSQDSTARIPQPGSHSQDSTDRIPQLGFHSHDYTAKIPQPGFGSQDSPTRTPQPGFHSQDSTGRIIIICSISTSQYYMIKSPYRMVISLYCVIISQSYHMGRS